MPVCSDLKCFCWEISWQSYGSSFVGNCLYLAAFKILSVFKLGILIMMCLGVGLFGSSSLWSCVSYSFTRLGTFLVIISSNRFLIPWSLSSFGTLIMQMLLHFMLSLRSLKLSSCFLIFFFLLFWLGVFLHLVFQIADLILCFPNLLLIPSRVFFFF